MYLFNCKKSKYGYAINTVLLIIPITSTLLILWPYEILARVQNIFDIGNYKINGIEVIRPQNSILFNKYTPIHGERMFGFWPYETDHAKYKESLEINIEYQYFDENEVIHIYFFISDSDYIRNLHKIAHTNGKDTYFINSNREMIHGRVIPRILPNKISIFIPEYNLLVNTKNISMFEDAFKLKTKNN